MNNLNPVGKPVEKSIRYSKKALEKNSEKVDANEIEVFSIISMHLWILIRIYVQRINLKSWKILKFSNLNPMFNFFVNANASL